MDKHLHFKNPPIVEALFDIKAVLSKEMTFGKLEEIYNEVKEDLPVKEVKTEWKAAFKLKIGETPSVMSNSGRPSGFIFRSANKKKLFQATLDGFTFNNLNPYTTWENFSTEAYKYWNIYFKKASPVLIKRLALRYINKIEIPLPINSLSEYLKTIPNIAEKTPHTKTSYFMRLVISNTENENKAIVINSVDRPKENGNTLPVIVDIDVFREVELEHDEGKIMKIINELRNYKNELFMENITDKTMSLFN